MILRPRESPTETPTLFLLFESLSSPSHLRLDEEEWLPLTLILAQASQVALISHLFLYLSPNGSLEYKYLES